MSDDKLATDIARAEHAERLLRDELLTEAFDKLEAEYIKAWRDSPARDSDGRERLWQAVQIVGRVRNHLTSVASHGKMAQAEIDALAQAEERKKRFGVF